MSRKKCTSIGGQAVIEGVMMRGKSSMATAVRDEKGNIVVESKYITPVAKKNFLFRTPFLRGIFNFIDTMVQGMGTLMRSGEVFEGEAEPGKVEKWFASKKINFYNLVMAFSVIMGLALSIGLFFFLPQLITSGIVALAKIDLQNSSIGLQIAFNFVEGFLRILIFVGYIALTSLMKDVRRTYMYHGAEHKTISCYENDLELTVENARNMTRIHDRCGTTFMFIVMIVSVLVFSLTGWQGDNLFIRFAIRLALLPVVSGVSYELLKLFAKYDNALVRFFKLPGLLLQKLTTKEPTDDMLEVAIVAFKTVLAMDADNTISTQSFDTNKPYKSAREQMNKVLDNAGVDRADGDWIMCEVLGIGRDELSKVTHIRSSKFDKAMEYAQKVADGMPVWKAIGKANFYGYDIIVNEDVLCPRPETEYLAEQVIKLTNNDSRVLDMCTGSGCIAIAVAKESGAYVVASDVSVKALAVADENIKLNQVEDKVQLVESDFWQNIEGKFDVIVANPPYIKTQDIDGLDVNVKDYDPIIALDGGGDGFDCYRKIIPKATDYLNDGGSLCLECGIGQAEQVAEMMKEQAFDCTIVKDLEGVDRIVVGTKGQVCLKD
ncbi:MAG: peptide chain release factor N(5)-glutamine methyltransferase [Christensenellales bacterium]